MPETKTVALEPKDYLRIRLLMRDTADAKAALDRATAAASVCLKQLGEKYAFDVSKEQRYQLNDDTFEMELSS